MAPMLTRVVSGIVPYCATMEAMDSTSGVCAYCGRAPAAQATFRWLVTVLINAQSEYEKKWYCRDCGLAVYRTFCERTLIGGWWGVQGVCVPFVLALNHGELRRLQRLASPQRPRSVDFIAGASGVQVMTAAGDYGLPLDPGLSLARRWTTYIAPVVFSVLIIGFLIFRQLVLA